MSIHLFMLLNTLYFLSFSDITYNDELRALIYFVALSRFGSKSPFPAIPMAISGLIWTIF